MAEEKKRISPAVGLGIAAGLAAVMYFVTKAKAAPPEEPEPGLSNLYGIVTDAETGDPLAGVSVGLWSPDEAELLLHTTTNSSGYYLMENILPGNYVVYFAKEGYEIVKKGDKVLVEGNNELNVEMAPIALVGVEITSITLNKTNLVEGDPFTIRIIFSNPHNYEVWVKPEFGFGLLTGEPLEFVEETDRRRRLVVKGFEPEAILEGIGWNGMITPGGPKMTWLDLGIVAIKGSNMTNYIYDPDGAALTSGSYAYLKVPAKGQATTSKLWHISDSARSERVRIPSIPWIHIFETIVYPPIDLDVCVKVESAFYPEYHPEGIGIIRYGLPEAIGKTLHYKKVGYAPFAGAVPDMVNVRSEKTPT